MKLSILNLLALVTIIGLILALITLNRNDEITLHIDGDTFEMQETLVGRSLWIDKSNPPDVTVARAYEIASDITNRLTENQKQIGYGPWEIRHIGLTKLYLREPNSWAYVVNLIGMEYPSHPGINGSECVSVLIMLDESIVFESAWYSNEISLIIGD